MSYRPEQGIRPEDIAAVRDYVLRAGERFVAWRRSRLGMRGSLPYFLSFPLSLAGIVALAKGQWPVALACAAAFALIALGTHLTRRALRDELVVSQRRYTRPPRVPLKYAGAGAMAGGTVLAAVAAVGQDPITGGGFGLLAVLGYHLAYRLPPPADLRRRSDVGDGDRHLRQALARAERRIAALETAADAIGNPELGQRLQRIAAQGRGLLDLIAERPDELFRARKFLTVYLEGAERVASRYAKTHRRNRSAELEQNFRSVLEEIETVFERQREQLLEHDITDLDVQITVLRQRLTREGIL